MQEDISDVEAVRLIETPPSEATKGDNWKHHVTESHETLQLDIDNEEKDPFTTRLSSFEV